MDDALQPLVSLSTNLACCFNVHAGHTHDSIVANTPLPAQGNLLEAVNVTLNLMQFHYMDRDLHRVGNSILIISAGCGVFEVDRALAGITYQRMMDNGIGSDMLSLGLPPLHTAPFFHYNNDLFAVEAHGVDEEKSYHEVPHWMHLSFFSYGDEAYVQDIEQPGEKKGKFKSV